MKTHAATILTLTADDDRSVDVSIDEPDHHLGTRPQWKVHPIIRSGVCLDHAHGTGRGFGPTGLQRVEEKLDVVATDFVEPRAGPVRGDSRYKRPVPRREELTLAPDLGGCAPRSFVTVDAK